MRKTRNFERMTDDARNMTIEQAFFKKALGDIEVREEKITTEDDGKGLVKEKREIMLKKAPPDLSAMLSWLRQRQPERWAEKAEAGSAGGTIQVYTQIPRPEGDGKNA